MYIKQLSNVKIVCSLQRKAVTLDIQKAVRHNLRPLELRSLSFPCTAVADIFHRTARRSHWLQIAARHCCAGRVLHQRINSRPERSVHQRTSLVWSCFLVVLWLTRFQKVFEETCGNNWSPCPRGWVPTHPGHKGNLCLSCIGSLYAGCVSCIFSLCRRSSASLVRSPGRKVKQSWNKASWNWTGPRDSDFLADPDFGRDLQSSWASTGQLWAKASHSVFMLGKISGNTSSVIDPRLHILKPHRDSRLCKFPPVQKTPPRWCKCALILQVAFGDWATT